MIRVLKSQLREYVATQDVRRNHEFTTIMGVIKLNDEISHKHVYTLSLNFITSNHNMTAMYMCGAAQLKFLQFVSHPVHKLHRRRSLHHKKIRRIIVNSQAAIVAFRCDDVVIAVCAGW